MATLFLACAVLGGTVFVMQFVMAIVGFGADDIDFIDDVDIPDDDGGVLDHGSTWLFGVISFRTLVAAFTFFGIAGMASLQAGQAPIVTLVIAICCGLAAMYGVHYLMRLLFKLNHDGSVHIERSIGKRGTVYIPIPGGKNGSGKIQLQMQERIMEYLAVTADEEELPTGTNVEVVEVVNHNTLQVRAIKETANA